MRYTATRQHSPECTGNRPTLENAETSGEEAALRAKKILETCLYVEDLGAAEAFYTTVMGLEKFAAVEGRHVFFRVEGGVFLLFDPKATQIETVKGIASHGAHGQGHAAFEMTESEIEGWRTSSNNCSIDSSTCDSMCE